MGCSVCMYAGNKRAIINEESLQTNSHNCEKVRLCMSQGQEIYDVLLGQQPKELVFFTALAMQLIYSRKRPTKESVALLYLTTNMSWIHMAHFDKVCREKKGDSKKEFKPVKPSVCKLHVHSWLEEIPLFMYKIGQCILAMIEEDFEAGQKLAKEVGRRSKRTYTEFEELVRRQFADELLLVHSSICARQSRIQRKVIAENKYFAHVEAPNFVIHACSYNLFASFTTKISTQDFQVLGSKYALLRCVRIVARLVGKKPPPGAVRVCDSPFTDGTLESGALHRSYVLVPRSERKWDPAVLKDIRPQTAAQLATAVHLKEKVDALLATKSFSLVPGRAASWRVSWCAQNCHPP